MPVTALYASLAALFLVWISARVIAMRRAKKIGLGDGGDQEMLRRMRMQANFIEYVPLSLILIGLLEFQAAPVWLLHILGINLLAGRLLHSHGFGGKPETMPLRQMGMILTFGALVAGALVNLAVVGGLWP